MNTGLTDSETAAAETFAFAIDIEAAGRRLDAVLAARPEAQAAALSRTRLKALIEAGAVAVTARRRRMRARRSRPGRRSK